MISSISFNKQYLNLQIVNWNELNRVIPIIKDANSMTINPIERDKEVINLKINYFVAKKFKQANFTF